MGLLFCLPQFDEIFVSFLLQINHRKANSIHGISFNFFQRYLSVLSSKKKECSWLLRFNKKNYFHFLFNFRSVFSENSSGNYQFHFIFLIDFGTFLFFVKKTGISIFCKANRKWKACGKIVWLLCNFI